MKDIHLYLKSKRFNLYTMAIIALLSVFLLIHAVHNSSKKVAKNQTVMVHLSQVTSFTLANGKYHIEADVEITPFIYHWTIETDSVSFEEKEFIIIPNCKLTQYMN